MSPFAASDHTSRIVIPVLHWLMPRLDFSQLSEIHEVLRKVGHFIGYGLMSYFLFRAIRGTYHVYRGTENMLSRAYLRKRAPLALGDSWRSSWAFLAVLGTSFVATCDELHQMTLKNRSGSWKDVLLDTIGGLIFQLVIFVLIMMRARVRRHASERVEV